MTVPRDMCDAGIKVSGTKLTGCHDPVLKKKCKDANFHKKDASNQEKRRKILNEIYETEKTYQHHLMLLTTLFLEPVKVSSIFPQKLIDGLFSNIEAIQSVSSHLLELMEEHGVVHSLLELAPYLKLYSIYANNFATSSKLLEELQKKSTDFTRLLKFQESREEMESLKLGSLLVTPIQRVPRYRLLLENLLEKTHRDDPNFPKLKVAYDEIANVTSHINECVRQHENFMKMLAIQNSLVGANTPQILLPGRLFLREGPISQISKRGNAKDRMLYLFNDLLICAKKETSNMYHCCEVFHLIDCIVEQVMGSADNGSGLFKVICADKFLLLCSSVQDDKGWVADIKSAISNLHENLSSLKCTTPRSKETKLNKVKSKCKVTSPIKLFKSKASHDNLAQSPLFADVANLTATTKRSTVVEPAVSVFDLNKDDSYADNSFSASSFTFDVDSFIQNNTSLFNNSNEVNESVEMYSVDEEASFSSETESANSFRATVDWTVTELDQTPEHRDALASIGDQDNICCGGKKRKNNVNRTAPYTKKNKKENLERNEVFITPAPQNSEQKDTPVRKSLNDSSTSCLVM